MRGFKIPNSILKCGLKHSQLLIYLFLLSHQKDGAADFTFSQISQALHISQKTVHNGIAILIKGGLICKADKKKSGRTVATLFTLKPIPCDKWVWVESRLFELELSASELNVYLYIKSRANQNGRAWPALSVISKEYRPFQTDDSAGQLRALQKDLFYAGKIGCASVTNTVTTNIRHYRARSMRPLWLFYERKKPAHANYAASP